MIALKKDIRATGFKEMCRELANVSGQDYAYVLLSEAATVAKIAALSARMASAAAIRRQVRERKGAKFTGESGEVSVNIARSPGRVWFTQAVGSRGVRVTGPLLPGRERHIVQSGGYYLVYDTGHSRGHHLPAPIWHEFLLSEEGREAYVKQLTAELIARRGIERLSWLQIGDSLGIPLSSVSPQGSLGEPTARAALVRGRQYKNGSSTAVASGSEFVVTLRNESPVAVKRSGQSRVDAAIAQRQRGFQIAVEKGLLDDLERRATRWVGIFVKAA